LIAMRIMGIDPGSMVTGYGFVSSERKGPTHYIACGCIRTHASDDFHQRIKHIHDEIARLIEEQQPDEVALEDIFYSRNIRSALQLGQARAAAILAALNAGRTVKIYSPREIKQALTGSGSAAKEQVQYMVRQLLDIHQLDLPLDASDALAIALCHSHRVWSSLC